MRVPRRLSCSLAAIALTFLLPGCQGDLDEDCRRACGALSLCGLLPSALGKDVENCEWRCTRSDNNIRRGVVDCVPAPLSGADWCSSEEGSCSTLQSCIAPLAKANLTGASGVAVVPALEGADPGACVTGGSSCDAALPRRTAEGHCTRLRASKASVFLTANGNTEFRSTDCVNALADPERFVSVVAGETRAGVVLEGSATSGAAGAAGTNEPFCKVFVSPKTLVTAGDRCIGIVINLSLTGNPCETGVEACRDGADNDGDTRVDCNDPKCASVCSPPDAGSSKDDASPDGPLDGGAE